MPLSSASRSRYVASNQPTLRAFALSLSAPPPPSLAARWRSVPPPAPRDDGPLARALSQASSFARAAPEAGLAPRLERRSVPAPRPRPVGPMVNHALTHEHAALSNPLARFARRMRAWFRRVLKA